MSELIVWCLCSWLGVGTPKHGRSSLCFDGVWAGPPAPFPGALQLPDPARGARVAARRAADARRAGRALDRLLAPAPAPADVLRRQSTLPPHPLYCMCPDCGRTDDFEE